jgi:hypothetical protein
MPDWLFERFIEDPVEYLNAQRYWERLFRRALPRIYPDDQLKLNYLNNPDRDGNPIFTGICRPLQLAVRVIQQPVGDLDDLDLDYWVDAIRLKPGGLKIRELVISCCPSEENQHEVRGFLRDWFANGKIATVERLDDRPWEGRPFSFSPELCIQ